MMNKKILITGATGFIGSHLTEYLVEKGCDIITFGRYNSKLFGFGLNIKKTEV